jgi:DNA-directed RNA polymerase specialized sigma24 family protein
MSGADDETLLQRARQLEEQALDEIYGLFSPAIYRYALRLCGSQALAEECAAETFSRLLIALSNGGGH